MTRYHLEDEEGQYSADPSDYWYRNDADRFEGMALVKEHHPFRTTTGRTVYGSRLLKFHPSMHDLRRLASCQP